MDITIDPGSATPPYDQVRRRIAELAAAGSLPAGTRLPPVRSLAATLNLAANTVARAYRELEAAGLVETRGRAGTVVTSRAAGTSVQARLAAEDFAARVRSLGIPPEVALALVKAALES
jgi:DNA-binding transcriptional regulator YhcF (GntR family)